MFFTHMLGQNCTLATFLSIVSPTYLCSWKGMLGQHVYSQTCPIFNFPSHLCPRYYTHIFARSKCVFATRLSPHSETYLHCLDAHCWTNMWSCDFCIFCISQLLARLDRHAPSVLARTGFHCLLSLLPSGGCRGCRIQFWQLAKRLATK